MLSVVCPVYNEAENIEALLAALQSRTSIPKEVLIVYDSESDSTIPVVKAISQRFPFEIKLVKK